MTQPDHWNPNLDDNAEVGNAMASRMMIFAISEHYNGDIANMPIIDVYALMDYIEDKYKNNQ